MRSCLTRAELGAMLLGSLSVDALSEAQAHLAGCARCRSELAPLLDPAKPEPREQSGADRMLGPYRTIRSIGRGGQGEVFLAEDTRLGRKVALKVLLAPDLSAHVVKRFHREALAASKLDHPGICTVYEAGDIDGILYIAMRYVDGRSLFEACSDDRTDIRRTLRIVERTARALHCAHEAGLVHRDVKPRNILVTREDEPVIVDFGLAHEESQDIEKLTLSGDVLGTPAYMSPEQLRGRHSRVDRRTDVYSLGVTLFQCLLGKLPFEADSREVLYQRILSGEKLDPRTVDRRIGKDLAVILETALETDAARRYGTALELAEDLRRVLDYEPIRARPAGPLLRMHRWVRRSPVLAASLCGGFSVLAVGLSVALLLLRAVSDERDLKVKALDAVKDALARSEGERLIAQSTAALSTDPALALLLVHEGEKTAPGLTARNAALAALSALHERRVLLGHSLELQCASFSPDGRRVVTASSDGTARTWDVESGDELLVLRGHGDIVRSARFSPDGTRVVTASLDSTARLWDSESGRELIVIQPGRSPLFFAGFSPDGRRLVIASDDRTVSVWDVEGRLERVLRPDHGDKVYTAELSPDGSRILTASKSGTLMLWDSDNGNLLKSAILNEGPMQGDHLTAARFRPDGKAFIAGLGDHTARSWDIEAWKETAVYRHESYVRVGSYSPDGRHVVTACGDGTARIWDIATGGEIASLRGHKSRCGWAEFSPDGRLVVTASSDFTARIWEVLPEAAPSQITLPASSLTSVDWHPDGQRLLVGSRFRLPGIWNLRSGVWETECSGIQAEVAESTFSPSGDRVCTIGWGRSTRVWRVETGEVLLELDIARTEPLRAAFSPDGQRLAIGSNDGAARVWDLDAGTQTLRLASHKGPVAGVHFSPDGTRIATASWDGTTRIWSSTTGDEVLKPLDPQAGSAFDVRFSPDGALLVTAFANGEVVLWSPLDGKLIRRIQAHSHFVSSVRFRGDGRQFITASEDRTARIWDSSTGEEILTLTGHGGSVKRAVFSPDGTRIATACEDGTARIFSIPAPDALERRRPRELTPDERDAFRLGSAEERNAHRERWDLELKRKSLRIARRMALLDPSSTLLREAYLIAATDVVESLTTRDLYQDPGEALDIAIEGFGACKRRDAGFLALAARALWAAGRRHEAVRALEDASRLEGMPASLDELLAKYRAQLAPDAASPESIDAAIGAVDEVALVPKGAACKFFRGRSEPSPGLEWTRLDFDDSAWETGVTGLGYGDDDDATVLPDMLNSYTSVYVRLEASIADPARCRTLGVVVTADDGFVAYLNGVEVARGNAGEAGQRLPFDAVATVATEPQASEHAIDPRLLRAGRNVLAVRGLNAASSSSDFSLIPVIRVGLSRGPEHAADLLRVVRSTAKSPEGRSRALYVEGRMAEMKGDLSGAAAKLAQAAGLDGTSWLVYLSWARCLEAAGKAGEAASTLRDALAGPLQGRPELWNAWAQTVLGNLRKDAAGALTLLPPPRTRVDAPALEAPVFYPGDLRAEVAGALETIQKGETLRINCGGGNFSGEDGQWVGDRFFLGGHRHHGDAFGVAKNDFEGQVAGTDEQPVLGTARWFALEPGRPAAYAVPVPQGRYRITLHFAELLHTSPRARVFDVAVEGRRVLESFTSTVFAVAESRAIDDVSVTDGGLDIELIRRVGDPAVNAIEIERIGDQ